MERFQEFKEKVYKMLASGNDITIAITIHQWLQKAALGLQKDGPIYRQTRMEVGLREPYMAHWKRKSFPLVVTPHHASVASPNPKMDFLKINELHNKIQLQIWKGLGREEKVRKCRKEMRAGVENKITNTHYIKVGNCQKAILVKKQNRKHSYLIMLHT